MFRKIAATLIFLAVVTAAAFGAKTVFIDGTPAQGIKGTKVTAEFLNKTSYNVPTGEDLEGSAPNLYGADTGAANAYVVNLTQGKKRATGTNTSTTTNKLIDSGATFQTAAVVVGDVVLNVTDKTSATVTAIDSQTQLALSSNIFTATSKAYAVGPNIQQLPQAYTTGLAITFKATNANTGASTVNVNSLGVKTIKKNGSADIIRGDIKSGQIISVSYDGTNIQLISPAGVENGLLCFWAYRSGSQTITVGTATKVQINAIRFDPSGIVDITTNYRVTPTVPGKYLFWGMVGGSGTTATGLQAALYLNGAMYSTSPWISTVGITSVPNWNSIQSNSQWGAIPTTIIDMNGTTDYVELWGYVNGTGTIAFVSGNTTTYLAGCRIGQ